MPGDYSGRQIRFVGNLIRDSAVFERSLEDMIEIDVTEGGTIEEVVQLWQETLPALDIEAFSVQLKLYQVNLIADRAYKNIADDFSLNDVDVSILMIVSRDRRGRPVRPSDLWRSLHLRASAITYRLDHLQELRLIERTLDDNDRRALCVKLTDEGLRVINEIVLRFNRMTAERLAAVVEDGGSIAELSKQLDRLVQAWTDPEAFGRPKLPTGDKAELSD